MPLYHIIAMKVAMWTVLNQHPTSKSAVVKIPWCVRISALSTFTPRAVSSPIVHISWTILQLLKPCRVILLNILGYECLKQLTNNCCCAFRTVQAWKEIKYKSYSSPCLKLSSCTLMVCQYIENAFFFLWKKRERDEKRGLPLNPEWLGEETF